MSKCSVPVPRSLFLAAILLTACFVLSAEEKTEIGELNGAAFRIDVPTNWNGSLVLYCHGYSPIPMKYKSEKPSDIERVFLDAGFAVAMSGYAGGGWAVQEGETDTLALKRYFGLKYGAPKQVYVTGHSMGGFLTMLLIERYPADFAGGLPLCGPLEPALGLINGSFNGLLVFNYFLPGVLPAPEAVPEDFRPSDELKSEVEAKLQANPRALAALERYTGLKGAKDITGGVIFTVYMVKEIQIRTGGSPFDNRSVVYWNTGDDNALNAAIKRYTPDAKAIDYLRAYYTPTGKLLRPMLAIHTTYDVLVRPPIPNSYAFRAMEAGSGEFFAQQYVPHDGHCAITAQETASGFSQLRAWVESGKRPGSGSVPGQ